MDQPNIPAFLLLVWGVILFGCFLLKEGIRKKGLKLAWLVSVDSHGEASVNCLVGKGADSVLEEICDAAK